MDNEATRLINDGDMNSVKSNPSSQNDSAAEEKRKVNPIAAAAGSFVAGAAAGVGATTYATHTAEPLVVEEVTNEEEENKGQESMEQEQENTPTEETPSAEHTSAHEDKAPSHSEPTAQLSEPSNTAEVTAHNEPAMQTVAADAEMIEAEPVDNEIHVLGVQAVETEDGHIMNVALLESGGEQALLVDIDNNGRMDVLLHDANHDGMIQEQEVTDISQAGIGVEDLMAAQMQQQEADLYYASNNDMPDYINDADCTMEV